MRRLAGLALLLLMSALIVGAVGCGSGEENGQPDSDGDGWTDVEEESAGTDPYRVDTDGDGYWDPQDPAPLDPHVPLVSNTPAPTPVVSPAATPEPSRTPSPTPTKVLPVALIPQHVLDDCSKQFLESSEMVIGTTAYQSITRETVYLPFSVDPATTLDEVKTLAEQFVRLVKSKVDTPPGKEIGTGSYDYVTYVNHQSGLLIIEGRKCAECSAMTWL